MAEGCLLYYITDRTALAADELSRRRSLLAKIAEAARAGVDYIQLREKDLSTRDLESLAGDAVRTLDQLRIENRELRTAFLINSRTDIALAVRADGVHLRSGDISPREVAKTWSSAAGTNENARPLIGVSCHSPADVTQASANAASFAVFAPVFEKKEALAIAPAGLAALAQACRITIPVLALGGVTLENAQQCIDAGAAGIAAIRMFQENDIATVVKHLRG